MAHTAKSVRTTITVIEWTSYFITRLIKSSIKVIFHGIPFFPTYKSLLCNTFCEIPSSLNPILPRLLWFVWLSKGLTFPETQGSASS